MEVGTVVQPETAKDPGQVETGPQQAAPRDPGSSQGSAKVSRMMGPTNAEGG